MLPLTFVPYGELGERAHVVVDGAAQAATALTLSHWPGSPTPIDLRADLSAESAFLAAARPELFAEIDLVTNDHFDQDGLMSAYALVAPGEASERRAAAIDVARAGDFGTFVDRDSARLAMAIAGLEDEDRTTLPAEVFAGDYGQACGALYLALLPQVSAWLDDVGALRPLWEAEDAHLSASLDALATGAVALREDPGRDLAVVDVPEDWVARVAYRFTRVEAHAVHPMAVNTSTSCLRVLTRQGSRYRLELRYETWVMLVSRPVRLRPDLRPLAVHLSALEPAGVTWTADPPGALTPVLEPRGGHSDLAPDVVLGAITDHLDRAAPAWDPFAARNQES